MNQKEGSISVKGEQKLKKESEEEYLLISSHSKGYVEEIQISMLKEIRNSFYKGCSQKQKVIQYVYQRLPRQHQILHEDFKDRNSRDERLNIGPLVSHGTPYLFEGRYRGQSQGFSNKIHHQDCYRRRFMFYGGVI